VLLGLVGSIGVLQVGFMAACNISGVLTGASISFGIILLLESVNLLLRVFFGLLGDVGVLESSLVASNDVSDVSRHGDGFFVCLLLGVGGVRLLADRW